MLTVTAANPTESRNACANLEVGAVVRCPGVSASAYTVIRRVIHANGDVALVIQRPGASSAGRLYPHVRDDKGGFWFQPTIASTAAKVPAFEIVTD
jgi:hypothetical protein